MKLTFYRGPTPNFGDELNTYLWERLLPGGFLDEDESELFLGIGSIIWDHLPKDARKHVIGSGYAGYTSAPDVKDGSWNIAFVRGPRTARHLGLPPEKAICDSALLLRAVDLPPAATDIGVAFIPHFQSIERGNWARVCRLAGIRFIDPTDPVETVLSEIRGARAVICEAMHGAIVADALRVPWLAVRPIHAEHHAKWLDWSEALDLPLRQHELRPSNLMELYVVRTGGRRYYKGRAQRWSYSPAAAPVNGLLACLAAQNLHRLAGAEPQLSSDARIEEVSERALQALDSFVKTAKLESNAS